MEIERRVFQDRTGRHQLRFEGGRHYQALALPSSGRIANCVPLSLCFLYVSTLVYLIACWRVNFPHNCTEMVILIDWIRSIFDIFEATFTRKITRWRKKTVRLVNCGDFPIRLNQRERRIVRHLASDRRTSYNFPIFRRWQSIKMTQKISKKKKLIELNFNWPKFSFQINEVNKNLGVWTIEMWNWNESSDWPTDGRSGASRDDKQLTLIARSTSRNQPSNWNPSESVCLVYGNWPGREICKWGHYAECLCIMQTRANLHTCTITWWWNPICET